MFLGATGAVVVPDSASLRFGTAPGFSAELWINPLGAPSGTISLLQKTGSFSLNLINGNTVQATVSVGATSAPTTVQSKVVALPAATAAPSGIATVGVGWSHVAIVYSSVSSTLSTYVNGQLKDTVTASVAGNVAPTLVDTTAQLVIGPGVPAPGAAPSPIPAPVAWTTTTPVAVPIVPILIVDEVKLSRVARTQAEIAISAFTKTTVTSQRYHRHCLLV